MLFDQSLPFSCQASTLLTHLIERDFGGFSAWWYGQEGQIRSNMVVCQGMPSADIYLRLLTLANPPEPEEKKMDYIDKIIAGDDGE